MKVAIVGGAGVFGSRLARLLVRDGHQVTLVGRSPGPLRTLAIEIGATAIACDRDSDLSPLWQAKPDAIVDAAGPFHAYGDDPYALPRAAIAHGVHYFDLADDAGFCKGITALDDVAQKVGVVVLSGMSSVPAFSSAVVAHLTRSADGIVAIASAILPGNRAARGTSLMDSILHQAGLPFEMREGGVATKVQSWSRPRRFALTKSDQRTGYMIRVPDQDLFPEHFRAASVSFHAGLELGLMNHGLAALAKLRAWTGLQLPRRLVHLGARLLEPFGTDSGGMVVDVVWQGKVGHIRSIWTLVARRGDGPFIPGVAVRAALRDVAALQPGARPALNAVPLAAIEAAMSDLAVTTEISETPVTPLFAEVLGADFSLLPSVVRASHDVTAPCVLAGRARIARGQSLMARFIATLFGFPQAADDIPVAVTKTPIKNGERWVRQFGDQRFHSILRRRRAGMTETFWPFSFDLDLHVAADALHFPVLRGRAFGIPMPKWLLPRSVATETEQDGRFQFDVALYAPLTGGLIVHYRGWLRVLAEGQ